MMKGDTDVEVAGIAQILGARPLGVPVHQRPYSWRATEVLELLDDVEDASSRKEKHFFGALVFINPKEGDRASVLDGQQRLATISLLLSAIARELEARHDTKRANKIREVYLHAFDIPTGTEREQLRLGNVDALYFEELLKGVAGPPNKGAPDSHHRLYAANVEIAKWVARKANAAGQPVEWLAGLVQFLHASAYVIGFSVADDANAFLIFETLNDRGLDLSVADLLKNFLLGRAGEKISSVLSSWTATTATLKAYGGDAAFSTFLRHYWSSKYAVIREKELYRKVKESVTNAGAAITLTKDLAEDSYRYTSMLSADHELWTSPGARESLRDLLLLGLEQYRPMLLAALSTLKYHDVEKLLRMLLNWNVRLIIVGGLGGGKMEDEYAKLGQAIRKDGLTLAKIAERAAQFVPSDSVFQNAVSELRITKVALGRYYLRALEATAQAKKGQEELVADPANLTLEHVLPQSPEKNWPEFTADDHEALWNRLGNMALLTQKMNSNAKSDPFLKKKAVYKKSVLLLTQEIGSFQSWNRQKIVERQKRLADLAVHTWPLKL